MLQLIIFFLLVVIISYKFYNNYHGLNFIKSQFGKYSVLLSKKTSELFLFLPVTSEQGSKQVCVLDNVSDVFMRKYFLIMQGIIYNYTSTIKKIV